MLLEKGSSTVLGLPNRVCDVRQWAQQTDSLSFPSQIHESLLLPLPVTALPQPWLRPFQAGSFASRRKRWGCAADRWPGSLVDGASRDGSNNRLWLLQWGND